MTRLFAAAVACLLAACAGGTQEARLMPTPILCKTILDLGPVYLRSGEYLSELRNRNADCAQYLGVTTNIRVR